MFTLSTLQDKIRQLCYLAANASSLDAMRGNVFRCIEYFLWDLFFFGD